LENEKNSQNEQINKLNNEKRRFEKRF